MLLREEFIRLFHLIGMCPEYSLIHYGILKVICITVVLFLKKGLAGKRTNDFCLEQICLMRVFFGNPTKIGSIVGIEQKISTKSVFKD